MKKDQQDAERDAVFTVAHAAQNLKDAALLLGYNMGQDHFAAEYARALEALRRALENKALK